MYLIFDKKDPNEAALWTDSQAALVFSEGDLELMVFGEHPVYGLKIIMMERD